jgi:hypothetical protein
MHRSSTLLYSSILFSASTEDRMVHAHMMKVVVIVLLSLPLVLCCPMAWCMATRILCEKQYAVIMSTEHLVGCAWSCTSNHTASLIPCVSAAFRRTTNRFLAHNVVELNTSTIPVISNVLFANSIDNSIAMHRLCNNHTMYSHKEL